MMHMFNSTQRWYTYLGVVFVAVTLSFQCDDSDSSDSNDDDSSETAADVLDKYCHFEGNLNLTPPDPLLNQSVSIQVGTTGPNEPNNCLVQVLLISDDNENFEWTDVGQSSYDTGHITLTAQGDEHTRAVAAGSSTPAGNYTIVNILITDLDSGAQISYVDEGDGGIETGYYHVFIENAPDEDISAVGTFETEIPVHELEVLDGTG